MLRIDTHKKYKDIYRVLEVFKVTSVEDSDEEQGVGDIEGEFPEPGQQMA